MEFAAGSVAGALLLTTLAGAATVLGAAAGFINGFLGGGGGVLVVALMLAVLCLPQKNAQATALLAKYRGRLRMAFFKIT